MNRTLEPLEPLNPLNRLQTYLSFVRFSHSVFALPFALTGALLAVNERPLTRADALWRLLWIVVAGSVGALGVGPGSTF